MTNKQHPAQFDWATELSDAQGRVTLSAQEAKEIGARLRSMGEKLKAYEDLDGAASDVQLLRMGYAAARLEIESLQARIKTMAEEHADELMLVHLDGMRGRGVWPSGEYPALPTRPEPDGFLTIKVVGRDVEVNAYRDSTMDAFAHAAIDADRAMRAAQPAGAQQPGAAYAAPEVLDALNWVDDFIARCNGDDRGACESVNVLRRAFASHGQAPARADMQDAYVGAREDLAIWKRRALEAERDLRAERETASRIAAEINAINGPTHLGEPAPTPQADSQPAPVREEEREAFKAAHRHLELDEVPDAWGRPMFKYSHVEASWLGWIARAARAPADSVTAPAGLAWRPIDTAPKDGTPVLLRSKKGRIADGTWITATSSHGGWAWAYVNQEPVEWCRLPSTTSPADSGAAPAGGANWQDISTAPKDGTRFVAVGQNYGLDSETQHTCIAQRLAGCWVEVSEWNGASKLKYLTHWMPLPPLPGSAASAPADSVTAPAGAGVAHALSDGQIEAMPVWRNFVGLWPESRREIVDAVVDLLTAPPTKAADSVLEDAARYRWLRERSSTMFVNISINGNGAEIAETLDSAVDAARKQGENHD